MYSTFQSHEPEFDYLKSLEIEEKINKIRWLKRTNPANFLLSTNGLSKYILFHLVMRLINTFILALDYLNGQRNWKFRIFLFIFDYLI